MNTNMTSGEKETVKKKRKFNIVDFLILFLVIALLGFAVFWATPWSNGLKNRMSTTVALQYSVEIQNVDQAFINQISEGNSVMDSVSKNEIGTVVAVEIHEHEGLSVDENGQGVMVEYPNHYDLIVTISSSATYKSGTGYAINGCRIAVGEQLALRFPNFLCEGYCIGLMIQ